MTTRLIALLACSVLLVACGDDEDPANTGDAGPDVQYIDDDSSFPDAPQDDVAPEDTAQPDSEIEDVPVTPDVAPDTVTDDVALDDTGEDVTESDTSEEDTSVGDDTGSGVCVEDDKGSMIDDVEAATPLTLATDYAADYSELAICTPDVTDVYNDWFAFTSTGAGAYDFTVTYSDADACLDVYVFTDLTDAGFLDGNADTAGIGTNSATVLLDADTTYYVQVLSLDGSAGCDEALDTVPVWSYTLDIGVGEPCDDDTIGVPTLPSATIYEFTPPETLSDLTICASGGEDYFELTLTEETLVTFTVDHTPDTDIIYDIYIYDRPNTDVDFITQFSYDESGTGVNTLVTTLAAGTWFVNVYSSFGSGPYSLTVSVPVPECDPACINGGVCVGADLCDCTDTGYTGGACETEITCASPCQNGGVCADIDFCDCTDTGYTGALCEVEITCTPACENSGVCADIDTCDCAGTGYTGDLCETLITCTPECANGGACVAMDTCDCEGTGFFGPTCEDSAPEIWVNEFHYDNDGGDSDEGVEIAGNAGADLTGWSLVFYNGASSQLSMYETVDLIGTLPDEGAGFGALWFAASIQNGGPDGFALVDADGTVVSFLSYEGDFTAGDGPAAAMTSTDVGVSEPGTTPAGESLQLTGTGRTAADFTWQMPAAHSRGVLNVGQTIQ